MFTGIIESVCKVKKVSSERLAVSVPAAWTLAAGESVAVDGACLTVVSHAKGLAVFEVSRETLAKTTLGSFKLGWEANLERALAAVARFGGHFVTGHVDAAARLLAVRRDGNSSIIEVEKTEGAVVVEKGSVALNGISLTVYDTAGGSFKAAVIPHTWENTSLKNLKPGALLNIEYDILGKYARLAAPGGITMDFLAENGFA
jgi:riboflavin synthase